ncbi:MAG: hypothetical protein AABY22_00860 [Nanoarchaeota archaeon]
MASKARPNGYWKDEKNVLNESKRIMKKHKLKKLPTLKQLSQLGYSSLGWAISKYYGFNYFREKLGEDNIRKPSGFFSNMEDEQLFDYFRENHSGRNIRYIALHDGGAYQEVSRRKLKEKLVENGILKRGRRKNRHFASMSKKVFVKYIKDNFLGKSLAQIQKFDKLLYDEIRERRLASELISGGLIIVVQRANGYFRDMSDSDLVQYVTKNYSGQTLTDLHKGDSKAYLEVSKRGMVKSLVSEGVLTRKEREKGIWRNLDYAIEEGKRIMNEYGFQELPSSKKLTRLGLHKSFISAINRYHGGLPSFRQLLNERLGIQSNESKLESIINCYVGGEDE